MLSRAKLHLTATRLVRLWDQNVQDLMEAERIITVQFLGLVGLTVVTIVDALALSGVFHP
jgi:hypothetical protein